MADETILVVDDSPTILKLVQLVLTKAGYRVATAACGEAGLQAARDEPPALVLLDYVMPAINGEALCREMSEDVALAMVPVVLMSAKEDGLGEHGSRLPNVADYITKPFSPEALTAVINHTLEKRARRAEGGIESEPLTIPPATEESSSLMFVGAAPPEAALAGDLGTISIADVLTLLQDQAQTGALTLVRGDTRLEISLRNGQIELARARGVPDEFLLGRFLVEAEQITPTALAQVIEQRMQDPADKPLLGADLLSRKLIGPAGLRKAVSLQTSALVFEGLRWGAGRFWFVPQSELPVPAQELALALPVDGLVMEGLRRVDEWRLIEREVGDFNRVFVRDENRVASFGRGQLLREELTVLDLVNGKNTVKDVIHLSKMGSFDVTKMLYRLLRNKLVRRRVEPLAV